MAEKVLGVSGVARQLHVSPRLLTDLFYKRQLDCDRCPVVDGRRVIPADYVPHIESLLRERRLLQEPVTCS